MTLAAIIDSMALVQKGRVSPSKKLLDRFDNIFVADLVCRHCWGPNWDRSLHEAKISIPLNLVSFTDFVRATDLQRTLGRTLAAADCATLALAESKGWTVITGCRHVMVAAEQLRLRHILTV